MNNMVKFGKLPRRNYRENKHFRCIRGAPEVRRARGRREETTIFPIFDTRQRRGHEA